jgi:STE24 endopeptidase
MELVIYASILIILTGGFLFENWLEWLNFNNLNPTLPELVKQFYNEEEYAKSVNYERTNTIFSFYSSTFTFLLIMAMLLTDGFALLNGWVSSVSYNTYGRSLLFFGVLFFASDLLSLPFQYYKTFVIEARFGFNKSSLKTFCIDKLKGWILTSIIGGGMLCFLIWAYLASGHWFFLIFMVGVTSFSILITLFYSKLIVPLFNKLTPLPDGELADAIQNFAQANQFSIKEVSVIDGSKRSTKANAYFSGFGPRKRIILYDTLINDLTTEEIVAVLAHETGHSKRKHIIKGMVMSIAQTGLMIALLAGAMEMPELSLALGVNEYAIYINMLAFALLYSPIAELLGLLTNHLSRKFEYEADEFVNQAGLGNSLAKALIKLSVTNLSNLTPHPWYVFVHYSHPPLMERIKAIKTFSYKI